MDHAGEIASSETWGPGDNPHRVTANVSVDPGAVLTILPGCEIVFETGGAASKIYVYGGLIARGTGWAAEEKILFRPASDLDFGGLEFFSASFDLAFCEIRGASWQGLSVGGGSGRIERCLVHETSLPLSVNIANARDPVPANLHVDHVTLIGETEGIAAYSAAGSDVRIEDSVVYVVQSSGAVVDLWSAGPALTVQRTISHSPAGGQAFQGDGFFEPSTCVAQDPAFVDLAAKDFRLRHDSPGSRLDRDGGPVGAFGVVRAPHPEQFFRHDLAGLLALYGAEDSDGGGLGPSLGFPTALFVLPGRENAAGARIYRKVFLSNERAEIVYDVQVSPNDSWPGLLAVEVALGGESDRLDQAKRYEYASGLTIDEIAPGDTAPVWFRMTVLSGEIARKTFYLPITIRASLL